MNLNDSFLSCQSFYAKHVLLSGLGPRFQHTLVGLLDLGYKCRIRLPLFISAGFVLCHIFSVYLPTVEINVEVIEENRAGLEDEDEEEEDSEDEEELSLADSDSDSEVELAAVVHILNSSRPGTLDRVDPTA